MGDNFLEKFFLGSADFIYCNNSGVFGRPQVILRLTEYGLGNIIILSHEMRLIILYFIYAPRLQNESQQTGTANKYYNQSHLL